MGLITERGVEPPFEQKTRCHKIRADSEQAGHANKPLNPEDRMDEALLARVSLVKPQPR